MPEGPEVRIIADGIRAEYAGKLVVSVGHEDTFPFRTPGEMPKLQEFRRRLPATLESVWTKGKKLVFDFGDMYLLSSLGMEGKWSPDKKKHNAFWITFGYLIEPREGPRVRVFTDHLYYSDTRHFGNLLICLSREELDQQLDELGYDVLAEPMSEAAFFQMMRNPKVRKTQICVFFMSQKKNSLCGIGNYIFAELGFACRLDPTRTLESLTDDDIRALLFHCFDIPQRSYQAQGHTLATYHTFYGNKGEFKCLVYGQTHTPEGYPVIQTATKNGRTTWWCPDLQH